MTKFELKLSKYQGRKHLRRGLDAEDKIQEPQIKPPPRLTLRVIHKFTAFEEAQEPVHGNPPRRVVDRNYPGNQRYGNFRTLVVGVGVHAL